MEVKNKTQDQQVPIEKLMQFHGELAFENRIIKEQLNQVALQTQQLKDKLQAEEDSREETKQD